MLGNLANCLPITLAYEGGYVDHPKDPGGATMKGITLATYRQYRPGATKTDLKFITPIEVERIYRDGYWKPIRGDDLPAGVDLATFDFGVNSGPARAAKNLQAVVGVGQDGKVGDVTIGFVHSANGKEVIQRLCGRRLSFVQALSTFSTFGKGWSRRIADVEAKAVAMFLAAQAAAAPAAPAPAPAPDIKQELKAEASAAQSQAVKETKKAGSAATGGGAIGGAGIVTPSEPNWILIGAVVAVVVAVVAAFVIRSRFHKERAEAYAAVAAAA